MWFHQFEKAAVSPLDLSNNQFAQLTVELLKRV